MKKRIILIAMLAIAGIATADFINGDFSSTTQRDFSNFDESELDDGWNAVSDHMVISGGVMSRTATSWSAADGIGQIITGNGTTDGSWIKFDISYTADDVGGDEEFRVILLGINDADANFGNSNLRLVPHANPAVVATLQMTADTIDVIYDSLEQDVSGTGTFNVDQAISGTGYDYYAIGFLIDDFNDGTTGDSLTIDNVSIVPASGPEATSGTLFVIK